MKRKEKRWDGIYVGVMYHLESTSYTSLLTSNFTPGAHARRSANRHDSASTPNASADVPVMSTRAASQPSMRSFPGHLGALTGSARTRSSESVACDGRSRSCQTRKTLSAELQRALVLRLQPSMSTRNKRMILSDDIRSAGSILGAMWWWI